VAIARRLDELTQADAGRFGGKAVQCGVLLQAGFAVPVGIGIAFDAGETAHVPPAVREWLDARPAMRFAVRSSATDEDGAGSSFAGIHESVLDVDAAGVETAIAECLASMSSERARAYRVARGLPERGGAAVLIQRMIEPLRAGVAFTADPVSGDRGTIVINSTRGRGEAVVGGTIRPEEVRVPKSGPRDALAELLLRIERHYGAPQDVEWCEDADGIWIVQARPITSLPEYDGIEWTRANMREVLPDLPSPSFIETFNPSLEKAYLAMFGALYDPAFGPMLRTINGRVYFNLTQMRRMSRISGEPEAVSLRALGHPGAIRPEDETRSMPRLRAIPVLLRLLGGQITLRRNVPRWLARLRAYSDECRALDAAAAPDAELIGRLVAWREQLETWGFLPVLHFTSLMPLERRAHDLCAKRGVDGDTLLFTFLGAGERSVSSQQAIDLIALARVARDDPPVFPAALQHHLDEYGHRGIHESDWSLPRFAEDPTPIHDAIRAHLAAGVIPDPPDTQRAWDEAWSAAKPRLGWLARKVLLLMLRRIKWMYLGRERYRSELVRIIYAHRRWHLELAKRFVARGWIEQPDDYFALSLDEVAGDPSRFKAIVAEKWRLREEWKKIDMPLLLRGGQAILPVPGQTGSSVLHGLCLSAGVVEAPVAVLAHPSEIARFPRGAILVTVATDPSWTPLFTLASGIIVEIGGTLSHAATVARELGLPALANVRDATKLLKDGMVVRLDATNGVITPQSSAASARSR